MQFSDWAKQARGDTPAQAWADSLNVTMRTIHHIEAGDRLPSDVLLSRMLAALRRKRPLSMAGELEIRRCLGEERAARVASRPEGEAVSA